MQSKLRTKSHRTAGISFCLGNMLIIYDLFERPFNQEMFDWTITSQAMGNFVSTNKVYAENK